MATQKELFADNADDPIYPCPSCGKRPPYRDDYGQFLSLEDRVDWFECGGACDGFILCQCACEYDWQTGEEHDPEKCDHCEWPY